ncbi:protein PLASTID TRANSCRIPTIONALLY ACTIVE 14 [Phoenix dactylifera]|uniref:Protein PLASTID TRANSCRIPTIONALLY ACTIVE 14 n=1 Tax=Phoenix dactylifera TaxID=42345 RepID=A0A8B7D420_PHODC|nr:protein PLASTID TRANSCRIPTIONALLY ACTIVE 14 [Phoenix dactylifera]
MASPFSDFILKSFARSLLRDNVFLRNTPHQPLSSVPSLAIPMASSSLSLRLPTPSIFSNQTVKNRENAFLLSATSSSSNPSLKRQRTPPVRASTSLPPFKLFELPKVEESPSELEPADPDFYRIGYVRSVRAYGIDFMEGPDGFGVYASRDVEPLRRARMIMEIPLELMLTISQKHPWMFFPDIIPIGHPIFDIINSTNPETDWDLRLACLLLYAFDVEGNFWQLYGDFLPSAEECTSFLQAQKEDLLELQDPLLASKMEGQQQRALEFWEKNWHSAAPLKIRRLAHDPERFLWALSIAQSRALLMKIRVGALVQDANMLVPYADMLNHSFQPNCFLHWRFRDRMLEVMINAGQRVKKGDEMTINYMSGQKNDVFMERYGFSSPTNPWDVINFSSSSKIHLDSFLSVFNISGLPEEFYHNGLLSSGEDNNFVNGAVIAAARTLPTWSDGDMPPIPSLERKAARELREECHHMLAEFPTTSQEDQQILDSNPEASRTREAAIKYRLHRKLFLEKVIRALELYQDSILF